MSRHSNTSPGRTLGQRARVAMCGKMGMAVAPNLLEIGQSQLEHGAGSYLTRENLNPHEIGNPPNVSDRSRYLRLRQHIHSRQHQGRDAC